MILSENTHLNYNSTPVTIHCSLIEPNQFVHLSNSTGLNNKTAMIQWQVLVNTINNIRKGRHKLRDDVHDVLLGVVFHGEAFAVVDTVDHFRKY